MEYVKVKRDGPRGWHSIAKSKYDADPSAFELWTGDTTRKDDPPLAPLTPDALTEALNALGDGWQNEKAGTLARIAEAISGRTPATKKESVAVITEELEKRKAPPPHPPAPGSIPPPPPAV